MNEVELSPFLKAVEAGNYNAVSTFLQSYKLMQEDRGSPLCSDESTKLPFDGPLLSSDCVNPSDWLEAVHIAEKKSLSDIKELLFECRVCYETLNKDGRNILQETAVEYVKNCWPPEQLEKLEILLRSRKFDLNSVTNQQETILHLISKHAYISRHTHFKKGITKILDLCLLIENGADVNRRNVAGSTALMIACETGCTVIVERLLRWRKETGNVLDLDATDNLGQTAQMIAKNKKNLIISSLFLKDKFLTAVENGDARTAKEFIDRAHSDYENTFNSVRKVRYRVQDTMTVTAITILPSEHYINESVCLEAIYIAVNSSYFDIALHVLDYVLIVPSSKSDRPFLNRVLQLVTSYSDPKLVRVLEFLLETRKTNVNGIDHKGQTVLHYICSQCKATGTGLTVKCNGRHFTIESDKLLLMFLRHNANPNQKEHQGKTPLMLASETGCISVVNTILGWALEAGFKLDLDARDHKGQTSLMKAALGKHPGVVKVLIRKGASVNISDNCGFTALHHAMYELPSRMSWIIRGDVPRSYEVLKRMTSLDVSLFESDKPCTIYGRKRNALNDDKLKTVERLFHARSLISVNDLDCEGYSALDLALFMQAPQQLVEILERKGAVASNFHSNNQQCKPLNYALEEQSTNILHRLAYGQVFMLSSTPVIDVDFNDLMNKIRENFSKLDEDIQQKLVSGKDQTGRTPLHYAAIPVGEERFLGNKEPLAKALISFGCDVNVTDNYGRTPMHYAFGKKMSSLLKAEGADISVRDNDGKTAWEVTTVRQKSDVSYYSDSLLRLKDLAKHEFLDGYKIQGPIRTVHLHARLKRDDQLKPEMISESILGDLNYAFRNPKTRVIQDQIRCLIEALAIEIKRRDSRFEVRIFFLGSSNEDTKIDVSNEFDFGFELIKFGELCEVSSSPELPTGFAHLRVKQGMKDFAQKAGFDSFFKDNGWLFTEKIYVRFRMLLKTVLTDRTFIESQQDFDWVWFMNSNVLDSLKFTQKLATTLKVRKTKLETESRGFFEEISIDIVPCFRIHGWWPDEAISVSDDIKAVGCILVFDNPQRKYPWVPYSDSCVRISFAPAESEMIKRSDELAKLAFMTGKQFVKKVLEAPETSFIMKTCLLYCIEAFQLALDKANACGAFAARQKTGMQPWLEILMKCYLDFCIRDFCPCYFMPSFYLPIRGYLGEDRLNVSSVVGHNFYQLCVCIYRLCRCVTESEGDRCTELPIPNPVCENFDRETFITQLTSSVSSKLELQSVDENDSYNVEYECPFLSDDEPDEEFTTMLDDNVDGQSVYDDDSDESDVSSDDDEDDDDDINDDDEDDDDTGEANGDK